MRHYSIEEINKINNLNIINVAQTLGYVVEKSGSRAYKIKNQGGMFLYPDKNRFFIFSTKESGGVIDLVKFTKNVEFLDAMQILNARSSSKKFRKNTFNTSNINDDTTSSQLETKLRTDEKPILTLPKRDLNDKKLIWYLTQIRKIDYGILITQLKKGNLYQDIKKNVVFLGKDRNGVVRFASLRGTNTQKSFKGDVRHSKKEYGFKIEHSREVDTLVVVESPIDVLSYMSLRKMNNENYKDSNYLSLSSNSSTALDYYLKDNKNIKNIILALDNDYLAKDRNNIPTNWGQIAARRIYDELEEKYQDKYNISIKKPILNDWNEVLIEKAAGLSDEYIKKKASDELRKDFEDSLKTETKEDIDLSYFNLLSSFHLEEEFCR